MRTIFLRIILPTPSFHKPVELFWILLSATDFHSASMVHILSCLKPAACTSWSIFIQGPDLLLNYKASAFFLSSNISMVFHKLFCSLDTSSFLINGAFPFCFQSMTIYVRKNVNAIISFPTPLCPYY